MDRHYQHRQSHLFTVRMWQEKLGKGQSEWRGKVQHMQSGEVLYFRQWSALVASLEKMLTEFATRPQLDQSGIDEIQIVSSFPRKDTSCSRKAQDLE